MGVYNPFAELPNSCVLCDSRKRCPLPNLNKHGLSVYRHPDCPLVEIDRAKQREIAVNIFDREEIHHNCTVQVLTNSVTGEVSVGWWENKEEGHL